MAVMDRSRHVATVTRAFAEGIALDTRAAARTRVARLRGQGPGAGAPLTHADPLAGAVLADPEPWFRELHRRAPVHYCPPRDLFVVNGFDEVRAGARAHDVLSSGHGIMCVRAPVPMLVAMDRPDHSRLRRILASDFTKARMDLLRPRIEELATAAVQRVLDGGAAGADAYRALAAPIPLDVIAAILGVPDADRASLHRWSDAAVTGFSLTPGPAGLRDVLSVVKDGSEMFEHFEREIERRRAQPGDDALSRLVAFDDDQGRLTTDELLWFTLLLLVGGNETTTSLLMGLLLAFARDPDAYGRLRSDPDALIPKAIEEGLRWSTPIPGFFRTANADYETGGVTIPAGARVMLSFGAANRDPSTFEEPERFVLEREVKEHLAFGSGIHFCLGSHLARLETRIVLETLVERVARVELLDEPRWRLNPSLRGIEAMRVRFVPA
ncbi:cytochrome P450 [Conexibacter sp. SYSU D00693]|uniref:cytochrome P450 n=1 Tax=Conexibacter sp. SYSU D00693 TaxID=2812560 RepID=UPI00196A910C|nr:cytochrome P450 [Conexibacter sp. SYSU D00693]